jgi:hypothetical protein
MSLAMEFGVIEVNPGSIPAGVWQMPKMPQTPVVNLAAGMRRPTRVAASNARPRSELSLPDRVTPASTGDSFELPQVNQTRPVQLEGIEFEPPMTDEPPGRARFDAGGGF